ncbi:MAG: hypothetical protein KBT03_03205 [Bacteroidales bacterium]|nr:hypothetical protein [Candidatus Scybalousia scybalohippi]
MEKAAVDFFKNTIFAKGEQIDYSSYKTTKQSMDLTSANESSNLPKRFWTTLIDSYDWGLPVIAQNLKNFATDVGSGKVCILTGSVGQGKSSALAGAIHERALNGLPAGKYFSDLLLEAKLRSTRNFSSKESEFDFYENLGKCDFLCIDEVGTSQNIAEERLFLRTVLMLRYDNCVNTMIATNMTEIAFYAFIAGIDNYEAMNQEILKKKLEKDPVIDRIKSNSVKCILASATSKR